MAFALLYVLWGSTYLAMRVLVRDMPPYVAGTVRYLVAGPIMLGALALMGRKVRLTGPDRAAALDVVLCSPPAISACCKGEEYVSSGLASLIVALVPLWVVMLRPGSSAQDA